MHGIGTANTSGMQTFYNTLDIGHRESTHQTQLNTMTAWICRFVFTLSITKNTLTLFAWATSQGHVQHHTLHALPFEIVDQHPSVCELKDLQGRQRGNV
jgi:hypothetical protein